MSPAASVGNNPDLLHHALILVAEDVTVEHEFSAHSPRELHSQSDKSWCSWNINAGLGRGAPLGGRYIDSIEDRRPTIDPVALCAAAYYVEQVIGAAQRQCQIIPDKRCQ